MVDWGFPNFDHRLDEPDPGPQKSSEYIQWRNRTIAAAKLCTRFVLHHSIPNWCAVCDGPEWAHSQIAIDRGQAA